MSKRALGLNHPDVSCDREASLEMYRRYLSGSGLSDEAKDEWLQILCTAFCVHLSISAGTADSIQMLGERTSSDSEKQPVSTDDGVDTSSQFELF